MHCNLELIYTLPRGSEYEDESAGPNIRRTSHTTEVTASKRAWCWFFNHVFCLFLLQNLKRTNMPGRRRLWRTIFKETREMIRFASFQILKKWRKALLVRDQISAVNNSHATDLSASHHPGSNLKHTKYSEAWAHVWDGTCMQLNALVKEV